ncbi:unnamed protein product, partial [Meganyctiphanes norvegica]
MGYSKEEILVEIQRIKKNMKTKGYGKNNGRIKTLYRFEFRLGLPISCNDLIEQFGIDVNPTKKRKMGKTETILDKLNNKVNGPANENAKIVAQFVEAILDNLKHEKGVLKNSDIMHHGSSYEGLVVNPKSDFDLPLILSDPFTGCNFKILRDPNTLFLNSNGRMAHQINIRNTMMENSSI